MKQFHRTPSWYFAAAISAQDKGLLENYRLAVSTLRRFGDVPTGHIVGDDPIGFEQEQKRLGVNVYDRDFSWLQRSVGLIADISGASTGAGAEVDYAVRAGIPTLVMRDEHRRGSWYLNQWACSGCPPPNLVLKAYPSLEGMVRVVEEFTAEVLRNHRPLPGAYVFIEGGEGSGKTYQREHLAQYFEGCGIGVVQTREPGGTPRAEAIRGILLSPAENEIMWPHTELFLFLAARSQTIGQIVIPAMREGKVALTDRNEESTRAYQGFGRQMGLQSIDVMNRLVMRDVLPDLGIVIDVDPMDGLRKTVTEEFGKKDRIESEAMEFHQRVRQGYLHVARTRPNTFVIPYIPDGAEEMQRRIREIAQKAIVEKFVEATG